MKNEISYEWCIETLDEAEDIIDNHFEDNLADLPTLEDSQRLVLCRNINPFKTIDEFLISFLDRTKKASLL